MFKRQKTRLGTVSLLLAILPGIFVIWHTQYAPAQQATGPEFEHTARTSGELYRLHIAWSTYLGGAQMDEAAAIAADQHNNLFAVGTTRSSEGFPTVPTGERIHRGETDIFLARFDTDGHLVWVRFFGGSGAETATDIAVNRRGDVCITGWTTSPDLPATREHGSNRNDGNWDAFVAKLSVHGQLRWAAYLGGRGADAGYGVAVGENGAVYVTGRTISPDFPTPNAFGGGYDGRSADVFLARYSDNGALEWARYLGGENDDQGQDIVVDGAGNLYVAGYSRSVDFSPSRTRTRIAKEDADAFVAKLDNTGKPLWSVFLRGTSDDKAEALALDDTGGVVVCGHTKSLDFETREPYDASFNGGRRSYGDAFVARLSSAGVLRWSTYLGGSEEETARDVTIDTDGVLSVTGITNSPGFPVRGGLWATDTTHNNAFLARFNLSGQLLASTLLGSTEHDAGEGIVATGIGEVVLCGTAQGADLIAAGRFRRPYHGGRADAFLLKVTARVLDTVVEEAATREVLESLPGIQQRTPSDESHESPAMP